MTAPLSGITLQAAIVIAYGPGLFWLFLFLRRQLGRPEPVSLIARTFLIIVPATVLLLMGMQVFFPALGQELRDADNGMPLAAAVQLAFFGAAIPEELLKAMVVWLSLRKSPYFSDPQAGMMYTAAACLGFASFETVFYTLQGGAGVGILRGFLTTIGHTVFTLPLGYAMGALRKARDKRTVGWPHLAGILLGYGLAVAMHGFYNLHLMWIDGNTAVSLGIWSAGILLAWLLWLASSRLHPRIQITAVRSKACSVCSNVSVATAYACTICQAPLPVAPAARLLCGACHAEVNGNWHFCTSCGARLRAR